MSNDKKTRFIWLDLETTGLDPKKDLILEAAVVITDENLISLGSYEQVVWQPESRFDCMQPFVFEMHSESGLLHAVKKSNKGLEDLQRKLLGMFYENDIQPFSGILAGSTVHFDKGFVEEQMPGVASFLSHRTFDTSTFKQAMRAWSPSEPIPQENEQAKHRAMADIQYSLLLAKYVRDAFFLPVQAHHTTKAEPMPMEEKAS